MAEYWDLYDREKHPVGQLHRRGTPVPEGLYHMVVNIWTQNDRGEFLLSQRHPSKGYPLYWEITGGSVLAGEDSLTAACRELQEELGIAAQPQQMQYIGSIVHTETRSIYETYSLRWEGELSDLTLQASEVVDAKWATYEELYEIVKEENFVQTMGFQKWFERGEAQ